MRLEEVAQHIPVLAYRQIWCGDGEFEEGGTIPVTRDRGIIGGFKTQSAAPSHVLHRPRVRLVELPQSVVVGMLNPRPTQPKASR